MSENQLPGDLADEEDEKPDAEDYGIVLIPEQKAKPARTLQGIQQSLAGSIEFPHFNLPESISKNIFAVSGLFEAQQSLVASAIKPLVDMQPLRQKQFPGVSSDIFKSHVLVRPNLNLVASQLTNNIDFSVFAGAPRVAEQFAAQQSMWLKSIAPSFASMRSVFYPSNLRSIEGLEFEEVEQVVMAAAIPLYGLPRASIAEALIRANGARERRELLGRRWKPISADCRTVVEECGSDVVCTVCSSDEASDVGDPNTLLFRPVNHSALRSGGSRTSRSKLDMLKGWGIGSDCLRVHWRVWRGPPDRGPIRIGH